MLKCPHVLVALRVSVRRDLHTGTRGAGLGRALSPLEQLSPSGQKEEPRGQRPSGQARQLGLELQRGGAAPSSAELVLLGCPAKRASQSSRRWGGRFIQGRGRAAEPGAPEAAAWRWAPGPRPAA